MRAFIGVLVACAVGCSGRPSAGSSSFADDDGDVLEGDPNDAVDIDPTDNALGDSMTFLHLLCVGDSLSGNAAYRGAIAGGLEAHGRSVDLHEVSQTGSSSSLADALPTRLESFVPPDAGVIWTGLDDTLASTDAATTLAAVSDMIGHLRDSNPSVIVVIAEVPPVSDVDVDGRVGSIDDGLADLVTSLTQEGSPVVLVTDRDSYDPSVETDDGTHPNDAGSSAVGHLVEAALEPALH